MISRASKSSILQGFAKSRSMLAGNDAYIPNSYESIATVTVGAGGSSSITFSSIPSTYKHLQIRCISTTSRTTYSLDQLYVRFNSDTGANYSWHELSGNGSSASAGTFGSTNTLMNLGWTSSTVTANIFGAHVMDLLDYADTNKYKTIRVLGGMDINGTTAGLGGVIKLSSGSWRSTSAVSTITITPDNAPFQQYSSFALYGVKG